MTNSGSQEITRDNRKVHITALDGWRGIACLLVFFYHTGANIFAPPLVIYGFIGVHLFFVLSGYLISYPFLKAMLSRNALPATGRFYMRRLIRIYPPYFVALVVFTALRHASHMKPPSFISLVGHATLVFNYFSRKDFLSINPVFWSLAVEMQFYLLLPLLMLLVVRLCRPAPERAALTAPLVFIGIGVVSRTIEVLWLNPAGTAEGDIVRYRSVFSFLDFFGFGILVAYGQQFCIQLLKVAGKWQAVIPMIGVLLLVIACNWALYTAKGVWLTASDSAYTICFPALICLGVALLLFSALNIRATARGLSTRMLAFAGTISYSIYLYHVGVQVLVVHYVKLSPHWGYFEKAYAYALASLFPTLILATLMYWMVERPSLVWAAKWKEQDKAPV